MFSATNIEGMNKVNRLYREGHQFILFTARGIGSSGNDKKGLQEVENLTKNQLREWGVKYHYYFLGKPAGDVY